LGKPLGITHHSTGSSKNTMKTRAIVAVLACHAIVLFPSYTHAHTLSLAQAVGHISDDRSFAIDLQCDVVAWLNAVDPANLTQEMTDRLLHMKDTELQALIDTRQRELMNEINIGGAVNMTVFLPPFTVISKAIAESAFDQNLHSNLSIRCSGHIAPEEVSITVTFPKLLGAVSLRFNSPEKELPGQLLLPGETSRPFPLVSNQPISLSRKGSTAIRYVILGFEHIVPKGIDHILFVLGLFLLSPKIKPLLWQVTAFTLAHSITLALSMFGMLSIPPNIVEPLIGLSIAFIAIENICVKDLHAWRPLVIFGFGLLHGLGFASVLTELGLPRDQFVTALVAFNLGVEAGQLAVITLAFLAVGVFFNRSWYRSRIVQPASLCIAIIGIYWTIQRIGS
jgi:HupE / UreJ protein